MMSSTKHSVAMLALVMPAVVAIPSSTQHQLKASEVAKSSLDLEFALPFTYVLLGAEGPASSVARSIVDPGAPCPKIVVDGASVEPKIRLEAGTLTGSYEYNVRICDAVISARYESASADGVALPAAPKDPTNIAVLGDTGLREKVKKNGYCKKYDKKDLFLGLPTCEKDKGQYDEFTPKEFSGAVQGLGQSTDPALNQFPYETIVNAAAATKPEVVIHVGDFIYTQSACPTTCPGGTSGQSCCGTESNNVKTGGACLCEGLGDAWGDNWKAFVHEFLKPSKALLQSAPWIVLRGDHEQCSRNYRGWFATLYPGPMPDLSNGCPGAPTHIDAPYNVEFAHVNFLVVDSSLAGDHVGKFAAATQCPKASSSVTANPTSRTYMASYGATQDGGLAPSAMGFGDAAKLVNEKQTIVLTHSPIYAVVCVDGAYKMWDSTLQEGMSSSGLVDNATAVLSGHMHWAQHMDYGGGLPTQVVIGNSGTMLISEAFNNEAMAGLSVDAPNGAKEDVDVEDAFNNAHFGFGSLTSGAAGLKTIAYVMADMAGDFSTVYTADL